jgi:hypothetical protein
LILNPNFLCGIGRETVANQERQTAEYMGMARRLCKEPKAWRRPPDISLPYSRIRSQNEGRSAEHTPFSAVIGLVAEAQAP